MNIKEAFNYTKQELLKAGVDNPAFDAIYLFEYVFSYTRTDIMLNPDVPVSDDKFSLLSKCIRRRCNGEPIQYITGQWYFMGAPYKVSQGVLIPRDDTEVLVCACMDIIKESGLMGIVDLCSGSGIIAITLKNHFDTCDVYAVEKSDIAYSYLVENCKLNNADIRTVHSDLYDCVDDFADGFFDLLVSNPPYIISDEISTLQREVQFEPVLALDGGIDGYDFYRGIIGKWSQKLKKGGYIAFEIGEGQFEYIKKLLVDAGFENIRGYYDLGDTIRAMTAVYNP